MLRTVASFREAWEAHMLRGLLETEGIPATVAHEFLVGNNWPWSTALGGVKVQVPRAFEEDARKTERSCRDGDYRTILEDEVDDIDDPTCPACGASHFWKRRSAPQVFLATFLLFALGVAAPPFNWILLCRNCKTQFRQRYAVETNDGTAHDWKTERRLRMLRNWSRTFVILGAVSLYYSVSAYTAWPPTVFTMASGALLFVGAILPAWFFRMA
jgi:hypothetical protein